MYIICEMKINYCVYNYIIIYTPFPYPKLCPYPKPTQQQTPVGTLKDPTNQIAARNLRAPIKPWPAGPRANAKPKREQLGETGRSGPHRTGQPIGGYPRNPPVHDRTTGGNRDEAIQRSCTGE